MKLDFALQAALKDWLQQDATIITALVDDQSYHFAPIDPWTFIRTTIAGYSGIQLPTILIHVALPRLYKNKPIYCIPLYHELGHFVDISFKISERCAIISGQYNSVAVSYFREHFADVFAASYCGEAIGDTLREIVSGNPASNTHPSTDSRLNLLESFLSGSSRPILDQYNAVLVNLGLPEIKVRFREPDIAASFDRIVPYRVQEIAEIHGLFSAGLRHLRSAIARTREPWTFMDEFSVERIVNDLVEKSVRNYAIRERWKNAPH